MAIYITNLDDTELFLPSAYLEMFSALQGLSAVTPSACVEHTKITAGKLYFTYFEDNSGRLKSIYFKPCEEQTS